MVVQEQVTSLTGVTREWRRSCIPAMIGVTHSGSRLPLELIFRIAELAIYDVSAAEYYGPWYRGKKTLWRTVEALSTSSKAYRAVTMEIWFRMLVISEPRELHTLLHNYPSAARWIR